MKKTEDGQVTFELKTHKTGPDLEEDEQYKTLQEFRGHFENEQDHHLQNMEKELLMQNTEATGIELCSRSCKSGRERPR